MDEATMSEKDQRRGSTTHGYFDGTADTYSRFDSRRFGNLPFRCTEEKNPGTLDPRQEYNDWSKLETTADQLRVEDVLLKFIDKDSKLLHVGVGNSRLAIRFAPLVAEIIGMTISPSELRHGQALGISNYQVLLWNKYCEWESGAIKFDAIIDNNPSTYGCCFHHLMKMFSWYAAALNSGGTIFTDSMGLEHQGFFEGGRRLYGLDYGAWAESGAFFGLTAVDVNGAVYALTKSPQSERIRALRAGSSISRVLKGIAGFGRLAKRRAVMHLRGK
jgi:hypothetical protein